MSHTCYDNCHSGCEKTSGSSPCNGCGSKTLLLCEEEISFLETLGQLAFLPVLDRRDKSPRYRPLKNFSPAFGANFPQVVESLRFKKLIMIEDIPLQNLDYGDESREPNCFCSSISLTLQGQEALTAIALL